jgi:hypothetical protein
MQGHVCLCVCSSRNIDVVIMDIHKVYIHGTATQPHRQSEEPTARGHA